MRTEIYSSGLRIALIMIVLLVASSCAKQKADITVHYQIQNSSGYDLKVETPSISLSIPTGGQDTFTDVSEGWDYYGSCSFDNVFEPGFSLTITYEGEDYKCEDARKYTSLHTFASFRIRKDSPREYTVIYSFHHGEIVYCLSVMGVQVEEPYYDYGWPE